MKRYLVVENNGYMVYDTHNAITIETYSTKPEAVNKMKQLEKKHKRSNK